MRNLYLEEERRMFIDEKESMFREDIIQLLEEKGYKISKTEPRSRQEIIEY